MQPNCEYSILKGPSDKDLITAYAYAYDRRNKFRVTMTIGGAGVDSFEVVVKITGLRYQDDDSGRHCFEGYIVNIGEYSLKVSGYYDANKRNGSIRRVNREIPSI